MTGPFGRMSRSSVEAEYPSRFTGLLACLQAREICECLECREAGVDEPPVAVADPQRHDVGLMCVWLHGAALKRHIELLTEITRRVGSLQAREPFQTKRTG